MTSPEPTDHSLLTDFAQQGSAAAFRSLADRYAGLVFSTALRRTGQRSLAEEVAQNVFAVLARKAGALARPDLRLAAWLHRATVLEASQACRREARRQRLMQDYAQHIETQSARDAATWRSVLPELDAALDSLPTRDRELLMARFFEERSYREIAAASGRSETALMQQQHRALEKMAASLRRRGLAVPVAVLAAGLTGTLTEAAPAGLAATLATAAPAAAASLGGSGLLWHGIDLFMQTKSRIALIGAAAVCLLGGAGAFLDAQSDALAEARRRGPSSPDAGREDMLPRSTTPPSSRTGETRRRASSEDVKTRLDRVVAAWRASTDYRDRQKALSLLDSLTAGDVPEVLRYLDTVKNERGLFLDLGKRIAVLWGESEPQPSLAWVRTTLPREHRGEPMQAVLTQWSANDPKAAVAWWQGVVDSLDFPIPEDAFGRFEPMLYTGWAAKDPAGLVASLPPLTEWQDPESAPESSAHAKVLGLATAAADPATRPLVLETIRGVSDEATRAHLAMSAALTLSINDPEAARTWATSLTFHDVTHRNQVIGETAMMHVMTEAMDPSAAVTWLRQHTDDTAVHETIDRFAEENQEEDRAELIAQLRTAAARLKAEKR